MGSEGSHYQPRQASGRPPQAGPLSSAARVCLVSAETFLQTTSEQARHQRVTATQEKGAWALRVPDPKDNLCVCVCVCPPPIYLDMSKCVFIK